MQTLISENGECHYYGRFLGREEADTLFRQCEKQLDWRCDPITIYGKQYMIPRMHCWYGTFDYRYSKITLDKRPMPDFLQRLQTRINDETGFYFNGVLGNLYRDGRDSNGWHRDNEKELLNPIHIASISLGEERYFNLRKKGESKTREKILLEHGSLLIMTAPFQEHWEHQIPKSTRIKGPRINLTFRRGSEDRE